MGGDVGRPSYHMYEAGTNANAARQSHRAHLPMFVRIDGCSFAPGIAMARCDSVFLYGNTAKTNIIPGNDVRLDWNAMMYLTVVLTRINSLGQLLHVFLSSVSSRCTNHIDRSQQQQSQPIPSYNSIPHTVISMACQRPHTPALIRASPRGSLLDTALRIRKRRRASTSRRFLGACNGAK